MSNQLILVPIEPLSERYTEQWYRHLPVEFGKAGYDVRVIDGVPLLDNDIKVGTFLDINSTTHYKSVQLQRIANLFSTGQVEQGASFFFSDIEFWGVEQVRLLARMNGLKIKMYGFLHAASYTKDDAFAVAADFQRYTEVGWLAAFDKVFVGSEYHKRAVTNRRLRPLGAMHLADRIKVTKNPMFVSEYPKYPRLKRKKRMLLTNRFDKEKSVHHTMDLFEYLKNYHPDWEFIITTGRKEFRSNDPRLVERARHLERLGVLKIKAGLTKDQYHRELAQAAIVVTHSREENYGLCVAESILYGCMPLMWKGASHPEFVSHLGAEASDFLFTNLSSSTVGDCYKAEHLMHLFEIDGLPHIRLDTSGMNNIIQHMKDL